LLKALRGGIGSPTANPCISKAAFMQGLTRIFERTRLYPIAFSGIQTRHPIFFARAN